MGSLHVTDSQHPRLRGCLSLFKRIAKIIVIILLVIIVVGVVYQTISDNTSKNGYSPRGQLYEVNGHKMHLYCTGEGDQTVVLQAGGVADSLWWYWIQGTLTSHTRVCSYDRAGLGWSEPTTYPRDATTLMHELHELLQTAKVPGPYIMAGHSFGAILARIYAAQYPQEVSGLVFVDSGLLIPREFADQAEFDAWRRSNDPLQFIVWAMTRTGILRNITAGDFRRFGYPEEIAREINAFRSSNSVFDTDYQERIPFMWDLQKAAAKSESFGSMPIAVIWAGLPSGVLTDESKQKLADAEALLSTYSANTKTITITDSDHGSILGNEVYAGKVSQTILDVVNAAAAGTQLK